MRRAIHRHSLVLLTIAVALLAPACDTAPEVSLRAVPEDGPWSPCKTDCAGGTCFRTENGAVCLPPCKDGVCMPPPVNMCGQPAGGTFCTGTEMCMLPCDDQQGCWAIEGMFCDGGWCVFP